MSTTFTQIYESDELRQARPGQPGAPVALPGYPSETASRGVKAPRYFCSGCSDPRDYDFVSGWSPGDPQTGAWLGLEIAGGDGFLKLPEHRHQYKVNGQRHYTFGRHLLTLFGAGYYGESRIPGLVPIDGRVPQDTIDSRQSDRTHTALFVASDT